MNREELRALVAQTLREAGHNAPSPSAEVLKEPYGAKHAPVHPGTPVAGDLTRVDIRKQYLVENPANREGFLELKARTPARVGLGRAGARYKTETMLRFRADHAAAQDSVFSDLPEGFAKENGLIPVQTKCHDKDEYLTRPDLGRRFDEQNQKIIKANCGDHPKIVLAIGDGLSSAAIAANALDCAKAIRQGLSAAGIELGKALYIRFCRVGASDHIGSLTGAELVCLLVGERPGLVTAESMSAYLTYEPRIGVPESARTVVSNIHRQGTNAVEAGAHIASLLLEMLKRKCSGVAFRQGVGQ